MTLEQRIRFEQWKAPMVEGRESDRPVAALDKAIFLGIQQMEMDRSSEEYDTLGVDYE